MGIWQVEQFQKQLNLKSFSNVETFNSRKKDEPKTSDV